MIDERTAPGVTWRELEENRRKMQALTPEEKRAFEQSEMAKHPDWDCHIDELGFVQYWRKSILVVGPAAK